MSGPPRLPPPVTLRAGPRRAEPTLATLVPEFVEWTKVSGYAEATAQVRFRYLLALTRWCARRAILRPQDVTRSVLVRYQRHLLEYRQRNGKPLSWSAQNGRLCAIRAFFRWLVIEGVMPSNPSSELLLQRRPLRLPRAVLTVREVERVLSQASADTPQGLRDRAILEVLYATAMRRMELIALGLHDIDFDSRLVRIRRGKGGHERLVPIGARACRWAERYLLEARPAFVLEPDDGVLFLADCGKAFHPQNLSRRVKGYLQASGVTKPGACHIFRHTAATLMLEGGADIRYIQQFLGHAEISTTQLYTQVAIPALRKVYAHTHPAGKWTADVAANARYGRGSRWGI